MAYELAVNPDLQIRLRYEVEETNKKCNGKLTYEALMKMKYLDMVVTGKINCFFKIQDNIFEVNKCFRNFKEMAKCHGSR